MLQNLDNLQLTQKNVCYNYVIVQKNNYKKSEIALFCMLKMFFSFYGLF